MRTVTPQVFLIAGTEIYRDQMNAYLAAIGAEGWTSLDPTSEGEELVEVAGRTCYRSFGEGLNPNVTKVREGNKPYLGNILQQLHGSVLEHAQYTFVFLYVSRVFTHELVRHRAGCAISQESLRYVRLDDLLFWQPDWAREDNELQARNQSLVFHIEQHQRWMAEHFTLDAPGTGFAAKKHKTSYMRRFAPLGLATCLVWSANYRTLRHVLALRTAESAEEEIRLVFDEVGVQCRLRFPHAFQDFSRNTKGEWVPIHWKV